ncbi:hypothetical protein [Nitratireductor sp. GCM10026969]|uniref:hypothetical protein n=1 Tax=Nitratireductor sp. GCM10026969 TaxID=3252645 RepID=UPI00361E2F42
MKRVIMLAALAAAVNLSGCATSASPVFIDGSYYMMGDADCARYRLHNTDKHIMCLNSKEQATGYRTAMTDQQLYMYQQNQMQQQLAAQQLATRQPMQVIQYPTMQTPQVTPITPPGGGQVRCISTGIYTNCRY